MSSGSEFEPSDGDDYVPKVKYFFSFIFSFLKK